MKRMKLSDLILKYREENNMSQREFARRADLSNSLISIIEKGYNPQTGKEMSPDLETYQRIARAMGTTVQTLFETLGDDASVKLIPPRHSDDDYMYQEAPKTIEAKIVSYGMDQLPQEQRETILRMLRTMYQNNPTLFEERN